MPCPHHNGSDESDEPAAQIRGEDERGVERREFLKSAMVIGGSGALSSAIGLFGAPETAEGQMRSVTTFERANRQHAWDNFEEFNDDKETSVHPSHNLVLHVNYLPDGEPRARHRRRMERLFDSLERTFNWHHTGLLFTIGYSASYFDRFDTSLPAGIDPDNGGLEDKQGLIHPQELIDATSLDRESPSADSFDAVIHLASDDARKVLAAEEMLWEGSARGFGSLDASFDGIFSRPEEFPARRVGFAGHENLEEMPEFEGVNTGEERDDGVYPSAIPDENEFGEHPAAELSMGFNDLFLNSNPRETNVTILEDQKLTEPKPPGLFAQGTIQHVSKLDIDLDSWYGNNDLGQRRTKMFSGDHTEENTGIVGEALGNSNAPGREPIRRLDADTDVARRTQQDAQETGTVGHVQKVSRSRFDLETRITDEGIDIYRDIDRYDAATNVDVDLPGHDGKQEAEQVMLRRDFDTTDQDVPGLHFIALMRFNPYMSYMRRSMNGIEFDTSTFGLSTDEGGDGFVHESVDIEEQNSGIVGFLTTQRRGNYIIPPLTVRSLPPAQAETVEFTVTEWRDNYVVHVDNDIGRRMDRRTVQFGHYLDVNRARGARPTFADNREDSFIFLFEQDDVMAEPGDKVRLFAKRRRSRMPLRGTNESFDPSE